MSKIRINGSRVISARPNSPVFFKVPAIGSDELFYSSDDLPDGVYIAETTGIISGSISEPGEYTITVTVSGQKGQASRELLLVIGEDICLTPFMGWNSWYCYSELISAKHVVDTAVIMVKTNLINHGWTYVNIDDCWQGIRQDDQPLPGNERFPDMQLMTDTVHALGLKVGIYSTPWVSTYAGFQGSSALTERNDGILPENKRLQHCQVYGRYPNIEKQNVDRIGDQWLFGVDAKQWAEWGFDYVKVDWLPNDVPTTKHIWEDLQNIGRDIVISLSNNAPFENASGLAPYCNSVRTTSDIESNWDSVVRNFELQEPWFPYIKPGYWPDPDMLMLGNIAKPNQQNVVFKPSPLTDIEQQTQFSLWCMLSAPLLISCDMSSLDESTLNVLCNDDLIDINQDYPAQAPERHVLANGLELWSKRLFNGHIAVGIFNLSDSYVSYKFDSSVFLEMGRHQLIDVWSKAVFEPNSVIEQSIPAHGVMLFKTID